MRIESGGILIRDFVENDFPLMLKWRTDSMTGWFSSRASSAGNDMRFLKLAGK